MSFLILIRESGNPRFSGSHRITGQNHEKPNGSNSKLGGRFAGISFLKTVTAPTANDRSLHHQIRPAREPEGTRKSPS